MSDFDRCAKLGARGGCRRAAISSSDVGMPGPTWRFYPRADPTSMITRAAHNSGHAATSGRAVQAGMRQSIPSSSTKCARHRTGAGLRPDEPSPRQLEPGIQTKARPQCSALRRSPRVPERQTAPRQIERQHRLHLGGQSSKPRRMSVNPHARCRWPAASWRRQRCQNARQGRARQTSRTCSRYPGRYRDLDAAGRRVRRGQPKAMAPMVDGGYAGNAAALRTPAHPATSGLNSTARPARSICFR